MNELVLILKDTDLIEIAFKMLWDTPGFFTTKKARAKFESDRDRFWVLARERNQEFFENCPEDRVMELNCFGSPYARAANSKPVYHLKYAFEENIE